MWESVLRQWIMYQEISQIPRMQNKAGSLCFSRYAALQFILPVRVFRCHCGRVHCENGVIRRRPGSPARGGWSGSQDWFIPAIVSVYSVAAGGVNAGATPLLYCRHR